MEKRYKNIRAIALVLALVGVGGYLWPTSAQDMPVRVLLENKGGDMAFSHLAHSQDYGISCEKCHHEGGDLSQPLACGSCHPVSFDTQFKEQHVKQFPNQEKCVRCHHTEFKKYAFDHEMHEEYASECTDCHHDQSIEDEPQSCSNCHEAKDGGDLISLKQAGHERCASCHEDTFEQGLKGCNTCHQGQDMKKSTDSYSNCQTCHEGQEIKSLIPTRTDAFHKQCMGCHEEYGAGPYGDKHCKTCHVR